VRLDKWLQVSRLVKRRVAARDLCAAGRVRLNGRAAKPGAEVAPGTAVAIDFGWRRLEVRVLATPERGVQGGPAAAALYDVLREERTALREERTALQEEPARPPGKTGAPGADGTGAGNGATETEGDPGAASRRSDPTRGGIRRHRRGRPPAP
jgi:ribosomal 50S subunit-recycling heat shock protein